jgi:hypothetical protein
MNADVGAQMTTPATRILGLLIESGVFYILIGVSSGVRAQGRAVNHEFPVFLPSAHGRGLRCDPLDRREARNHSYASGRTTCSAYRLDNHRTTCVDPRVSTPGNVSDHRTPTCGPGPLVQRHNMLYDPLRYGHSRRESFTHELCPRAESFIMYPGHSGENRNTK